MAKLIVPRLDLRFGDQVISVTRLGEQQIQIGDRTFDVERVGHGRYRVSDGGQQMIVFVAGPADSRWVWAAGTVARGEVLDADRPPRQRGVRGAGQLAAPMPATVVKVLVKPGDIVRVGDTVLVLEAMKMELPIRAPREGLVKAVRCQIGELVQPGIDLLDIE